MATATVMTAPVERVERIWETAPGLYGTLATVDHKIIGLAALGVFLHERRRCQEPGGGEGPGATARPDPVTTRCYIARTGALPSTIFTAIVVFNGIALFIVPTCSY